MQWEMNFKLGKSSEQLKDEPIKRGDGAKMRMMQNERWIND
jgi:hypothetical protein